MARFAVASFSENEHAVVVRQGGHGLALVDVYRDAATAERIRRMLAEEVANGASAHWHEEANSGAAKTWAKPLHPETRPVPVYIGADPADPGKDTTVETLVEDGEIRGMEAQKPAIALKDTKKKVFDYLRAEVSQGRDFKPEEAAAALSLSKATIYNQLGSLLHMGLVFKEGHGRGTRWDVAGNSNAQRETQFTNVSHETRGRHERRSTHRRKPGRRFDKFKVPDPESVRGLPSDHLAVTEARTLFPSTVVAVEDSPRVFVSGHNSPKLGDLVTKGPWKGMPIYQLTLEERATCPSSCANWLTCYGNSMPQGRRHEHGPALVERIEEELTELQGKYPAGFVIRLHVLGDFYSEDYVQAWEKFLHAFPALHVFGYTAHARTSPIGSLLFALTSAQWSRFAIRFSDAEPHPQGAVTLYKKPDGQPENMIVCPAQTHKDVCCGSCGLCWAEPVRAKTIAFLAHGKLPGDKLSRVKPKPAPARASSIKLNVPVKRHFAPVPKITGAAPDALRAYLRSKGIMACQITPEPSPDHSINGKRYSWAQLIALVDDLRKKDGLAPLKGGKA